MNGYLTPELDAVMAAAQAHRRRREDAMLDGLLMVGPAQTAASILADAKLILSLQDRDTWALSVDGLEVLNREKARKCGGERAALDMLAVIQRHGIRVDTDTGMREMMGFLGTVERTMARLGI